MSTRSTTVAGVALVAAMVVGGLVAAVAYNDFLLRYRAQIDIPVFGNVELYRQSVTTLQSAEALDRYIRATGSAKSEAVQAMQEQFARGRSDPVAFSHVFGLSRNDLRDLPTVTADELARANARASNPPASNARASYVTTSYVTTSYVTTIAKMRDPSDAIELAAFAARFGRDVLLGQQLQTKIDLLAMDARREAARGEIKLIDKQMEAASVKRQIEGLQLVRNKYAGEVGATVGGVQVQVTGPQGPLFLSPVQQLVGLDSKLVDLTNDMEVIKAHLERNRTLVDLSDAMEARLKEPTTARQTLTALGQIIDNRMRPDASEPVRAALADARQMLLELQVTLVDPQLSPPEPVAIPQGPPRSLIILAGIALGFALWLVGLRGLMLWRNRA